MDIGVLTTPEQKVPPHTHQNRTSTCFMVGVIQGHRGLSSTLRRTQALLFNPKVSNFDPSVQMMLFYCSVVQSLCTLAHWNLLTLFCFINSGFLIVVLPFRLASQSSLHSGRWHIFFRVVGSVVHWSVSLPSRKHVTDEIVHYIGKTDSI